MKISVKRAFSLIEIMIALIIISCITAAFAPVISKKMKTNEITVNQPSLSEYKKIIDTQTLLDALKDCSLNEDKTKLICEVELSDSKNNNNFQDNQTLKVKYSERRDKIRFDNREEGNYTTSNFNIKKQNVISVPIKNNKFIIQEDDN